MHDVDLRHLHIQRGRNRGALASFRIRVRISQTSECLVERDARDLAICVTVKILYLLIYLWLGIAQIILLLRVMAEHLTPRVKNILLTIYMIRGPQDVYTYRFTGGDEVRMGTVTIIY